MNLKKARADAFVTAVERRLAPLQGKQGKTAQARRRDAEAFDVVMTTELGIAPIPAATEEHTLPVPGHPDARLRVYWPTEHRPDPVTGGF
jgi:acetyl esterase